MHRTFAAIFSIVLLAGTALCAADNSPPLSDRVPDDAMIYAGWCGSDSLTSSPAYAQSHLKAMLDSSNVRELFAAALPRLFDKIAKKGAANAAATVKEMQLVYSTLWKYPCSLYFKIDVSGTAPTSRGAVFVRAGTAAPELQRQFDEILSRANPQPDVPIHTFVVDDILGLSIGFDDGAASILKAGDLEMKPLADSAEFKTSLAHLTADRIMPAAVLYVNGEAILTAANTLVTHNPQAAAMWPRVKEATGLAGFHHAIAACGFDGKDWSNAAFIAAPSPRKGLFAMGEHPPITDESLAMIPASATSASVFDMNLAGAVGQVHAMLGEVDAKAASGFNMVMGMAQLYTAVNLEKDLFAALGENWLIYQDPQIAGPGALGTVIVNKLVDSAKAEKSLNSLANTVNNLLVGATRKDDIEVAFRQLKSGDITVNYFAVPLVAPSWTIHDGYLYASLYPQAALTAAQRGKPAKSILENDRFIAMRARLDVKQPTSISFDDLPASVPQNYQTMLMMTRLVLGGLDIAGAKAPELVLPPLPELTALLAPEGAASWVDDDGIHWRSVTPFPAAGLVTGPGANAVIAAPAIMMSITLPALNRARETANRIKCASNLRQIGQAILLYSNEHKGQYPADLGALLEEEITPDAFICPDTNHRVPANWNAMSPDQKTEWVNKNSDYEYLGNGMDNSAPADLIVAFERGDPHGNDGINMLFGDGHVSFETLASARQMIADQGDRKK